MFNNNSEIDCCCTSLDFGYVSINQPFMVLIGNSEGSYWYCLDKQILDINDSRCAQFANAHEIGKAKTAGNTQLIITLDNHFVFLPANARLYSRQNRKMQLLIKHYFDNNNNKGSNKN